MQLSPITINIAQNLQRGCWRWSGKCLSIQNRLLPQAALSGAGCAFLWLCFVGPPLVVCPDHERSDCPSSPCLLSVHRKKIWAHRSVVRHNTGGLPVGQKTPWVQLFSQVQNTHEIYPVLKGIATHPREACIQSHQGSHLRPHNA